MAHLPMCNRRSATSFRQAYREARKVRKTRPAVVGMDQRWSRGRRRTPPRSRAYELWPDARRLTSSCSSVVSFFSFLSHTLPHPSKPVYLTGLLEIARLSISFSLTHKTTKPPLQLTHPFQPCLQTSKPTPSARSTPPSTTPRHRRQRARSSTAGRVALSAASSTSTTSVSDDKH